MRRTLALLFLALAAVGCRKSASSSTTDAGVTAASAEWLDGRLPKDDSSPVDGGTLVVRLMIEPASLNSLDDGSNDATVHRIMHGTVVESLLELDRVTYQLAPGLAAKWTESDDHRTDTFVLRDATFSDGAKLTAADVVATLDVVMDTARPTGTIRGTLSSLASWKAIDPKTVEVTLREPGALEAMNAMTQIEVLQVALDAPAKVIINERTGTVIMGQEVRIAPVAVAHGTLQVEIKTDYGVSQPNSFSGGQTVVVPDSQIVATEGSKHSLAVLPPGVTLGQLVNGLNLLGVTPQDLIAVLEAIKTAGALQAELEIM